MVVESGIWQDTADECIMKSITVGVYIIIAPITVSNCNDGVCKIDCMFT